MNELLKSDFGPDFVWGVSASSYQIEGAHDCDGKGKSIWDVFTNEGKRAHANISCDFYNKYRDDLRLMRSLNIRNFRFSLSWPRMIPNGTGMLNMKGIDFYNRLIDECLELGIEPWITLYHWDLPQALEDKGGWTNRDIIGWFSEYTEVCARSFGDRVKHWMVLNEPMVFLSTGYMLGMHAPGRMGLGNFIPAVHHAAICQAEGGRILKGLMPTAEVGTTASLTRFEPQDPNDEDDVLAVRRVNALVNRVFIEAPLGLGYPFNDFDALLKLQKYMQPGDEVLLKHDFDFFGFHNYTREIIKHSYFIPVINADIVKASKRKVPATEMDWEIYPDAMYHVLKEFGSYENMPKIYITENGAAFPDEIANGKIHDTARVEFLKNNLKSVLKAKSEGINIHGYFVWTFLDNFEWAEGFRPRFGLVHVDFETQQRTVKDSGLWYSEFLRE
ncbi:MAG TPA: GH1 family beta-glucosidase [Patescibacteria group bacterium]|nr:GH1 family beta-glucosidase [Patescibacteria group bacterium]